MTTQPVRDYLTKQLEIEKNIVTYRSLSRVLALNVNVAKNELAEFHATDGQNLAATYLLSGRTQKSYDEDVDMDEDDRHLYDEDYEDDGEEGDYVPQAEMVLVNESDLESAQAQFTVLDSIHVYSLSPVAIRDDGLLCTPTHLVRELDAKKGSELATVVGKVISAQVTVSNKPLPSWGGRKPPAPPVAGPSKVAPQKDDPKPKEQAKPEKPKATGKLDFSKAKTKPVEKPAKPVKPKVEAKPKAETKPKVESRAPSVTSTIGEKVQAKMEESKKRGTKRKSALASDSEEEEKPAKPVAQAQSSVRVRKGVILSDDEDDAPQPARKSKGKGKASVPQSDSEADKDLRAMMDIDDDAVTRASRDAEPDVEPNDEPIDVDMEDVISKPAPVKRKPKKVIPVGKNGLKKKRIVKSKTRIDEKGYMVTEDYSEYESVDEEEPAPPPKGKAKAKDKEKSAAEAAPAKPKPAPNAAPAKAKLKPSGVSTKGGQQAGLASFFGKSKSK
ncbi:DNA polymerase subunit Cdc27 [Mycena vitilis]|nr:DNA polymerase subunit Cdc27 [Mycena vitilis]